VAGLRACRQRGCTTAVKDGCIRACEGAHGGYEGWELQGHVSRGGRAAVRDGNAWERKGVHAAWVFVRMRRGHAAEQTHTELHGRAHAHWGAHGSSMAGSRMCCMP
jgi:hypothetical protein